VDNYKIMTKEQAKEKTKAEQDKDTFVKVVRLILLLNQ
jgi:hypothetical protein